MAIAFAGISLGAPVGDPAINAGGTFTMQADLTWSGGHGGNEATDVYYEYATVSGGPYVSIPTSGSELSAAVASPVSGVIASPVSTTITGEGAGTYYVRVRGVAAATFSSAEQEVTVAAAAATVDGTFTLDDDTVSSSATLATDIDSAFTLDDDTVSSSATLATEIDSAFTLDDDTLSSDASVVTGVTAGVAFTLDDDTLNSSSALSAEADSSFVLGDDTVSSSATLAAQAESAFTLEDGTVAAATAIDVTADVVFLLDDMTVSSAVEVFVPPLTEALQKLNEYWRFMGNDVDNHATRSVPQHTGGAGITLDVVGTTTVTATRQEGALVAAPQGSEEELILSMVTDIWRRVGLDKNNPLVVSNDTEAAGDIVIGLSDDAGVVTLARHHDYVVDEFDNNLTDEFGNKVIG